LSDFNFDDEAGLVAQAKTDPEAFGALYERYVQKIYSYVYYRTGNQHDAEDLTAKVFQRALVSLDRYTSRGLPFSAWLYRIAHNLVANWHRDQGPANAAAARSRPPRLAGPAHRSARLASKRRVSRRLLAAVRRLSDERQQIVLKFVERPSTPKSARCSTAVKGPSKASITALLVLRDELLKPPELRWPGVIHPSPSAKEPT
jgi:RNA polymerase sigma-70 factor (ECF subfamily)